MGTFLMSSGKCRTIDQYVFDQDGSVSNVSDQGTDSVNSDEEDEVVCIKLRSGLNSGLLLVPYAMLL